MQGVGCKVQGAGFEVQGAAVLLSRPFLNENRPSFVRFLKMLPVFFCDFGDIQRKFQVKQANNMFIVPL